MAQSIAPEASSSEDVADFLRRIKELGDKRDQEDEERTRKLEEEIMEGRRVREARRAERARSLSPEKVDIGSRPSTPHLTRGSERREGAESPFGSPRVLQPSNLSRTASRKDGDALSARNAMTSPEGKEQEKAPQESVLERIASPTKSPPSSNRIPARTGTLSWQQKPSSSLGAKSRPFSMIDRASSPLGSQTAESSNNVEPSRDQISQSLASKDPAWFRQSRDRESSAAAFRRNREETEKVDTSERRALPGMSRRVAGSADERNAESEDSAPVPTLPTDSSRASPSPSLASPPPASQASKVAAQSNGGPGLRSAIESPSSRFPQPRSAERSLSPTKGLGGFVQSAMKRSDSVSKRWSVQTPTGLSRHGSSAGLRDDSLSGSQRLESTGQASTPNRQLPSNSLVADRKIATPHTPSWLGNANNASSADPGPLHVRAESVPFAAAASESKPEDPMSPPSPSKRWSPVKSSWLESALSRPSSPQPATSPSQPAWLSELNKSKQQRNSVDLRSGDGNVDRPGIASSTSNARDTKMAPAKPKPMSLREKPAGFNFNQSVEEPPSKPKPMSLRQKPAGFNLDEPTEEPPRRLKPDTATDSHSGARPTPPGLKPKPDVGPKTDFRSNLKSAASPVEEPKKEELEFRNAFGKLKPTQPERFTPQNELKDNILRGKAGLSPTEGPQAPSKKDELKDSLIKQRQALAAKTATAALQKQALEPTMSSGNILPDPDKADISGADSQEEKPVLPLRPAATFSANASSSGGKAAGGFHSNLSAVLARGSPSGSRVQSPNLSPSVSRSEEPSSGPLQHMTKGRARGPKRRLPNAGVGDSTPDAGATAVETRKPAPATKSTSLRNVKSSRLPAPSEVTEVSSRASVKPWTAPKPTATSVREQSPETEERPMLPPRVRSSEGSGLQRSPSLPMRPSKPSGLRSPSGTVIEASEPSTSADGPRKDVVEKANDENVLSVRDATAQWGRRVVPKSSDDSGVKAPIKLPTLKDERQSGADAGLRRAGTVSGAPSRRGFPFERPTEAGATQNQQLGGAIAPPTSIRPQPPKTARKPSAAAVEASRKVSQTNGTCSDSQAKHTEASQLFADFFDDACASAVQLDVDTQAIVNVKRDNDATIKTLRKDISELSAEGKTTALPPHQDHVLFDRNMYICTHIFGDSTGARMTEVYLWAGSSIPDGTVEEAQIFARKIAKDGGGRLQVLRQGKESSNFLQALGGILITRYGTVKDHKKTYILCGRRHLGHIAFDEVDLSPANLCSGFPFIVVSAASNTVYLWKGKGCHTEELAGARLMSMDLGLSSRVIEVEEGRETADFFSAFPTTSTKQVPDSADHWKLKAKNAGYHVRLFRVERSQQQDNTVTALWNRVRQPVQPESGSKGTTQVMEIAPFCEADVEPENIYVLDAFFEVYILLGPLARTKYPAFASALLFAQDYAIVTASAQDRPFVPPGTVIMLEGALPRHIRPVFRQYGNEENMPTGALMAGKARSTGEERARTIPLPVAIAATRGS